MLYKIIQDFQYLNSENVISVLKKGLTIDRRDGQDYIISALRKDIRINVSIVESNPNFFEKTDIKSQLTTIIKESKGKSVLKTVDVLDNFINDEVINNKILVSYDLLSEMLDACRLMYKNTENEKWLLPINKLGWSVDENTVYKE